MADFDADHDDADLPAPTDRDDAIWFLQRNDIRLPDGLTVEKIK